MMSLRLNALERVSEQFSLLSQTVERSPSHLQEIASATRTFDVVVAKAFSSVSAKTRDWLFSPGNREQPPSPQEPGPPLPSSRVPILASRQSTAPVRQQLRFALFLGPHTILGCPVVMSPSTQSLANSRRRACQAA